MICRRCESANLSYGEISLFCLDCGSLDIGDPEELRPPRARRVRCRHCGFTTYALGAPPWLEPCHVCKREGCDEVIS